jgi:arylsulfatase
MNLHSVRYLLFVACSLFTLSIAHAQSPTAKPNILIILADDMGYSDASCYGGEIQTPNLDALAKGGLRFTQFYNTARCWPSRAAILTGYYAQQVRRDTLPGVPSGGAGVRPKWARLLPEMLKPLGYHSYHSGKWHVDGLPLQNGFEHSYSLNDHNRHFAPQDHTEDDKPLPPVKPGDNYYTTTAIADYAIKHLKGHAQQFPKQPFFEYVAFTSPHFPVQASQQDIATYLDSYMAGWDSLRQDRWQRMQAMKIGGAVLPPIERTLGPPYPFPSDIAKLGPDEVNRPLAWTALNLEQRMFQAQKMAIHAAMVARMDKEIGHIIDQVRAMGALDNTLILFMSDNGASAEMMVRGDGHDLAAEPGSGATFLSIGPGWSSLANTPFRRHKTWVHEGGISTPLIAHWPQGIRARNELRTTPSHLIDLVPTILEAVGGKLPAQLNSEGIPAAPGKSLLPAFVADVPIARDSLWWFHDDNRALRVGDWKIVSAGKDRPWELYDLTTDRSETVNLAKEKPDKVAELAAIWQRQFDEFLALAKKDLPTQASPPHPHSDSPPIPPLRVATHPSFRNEPRRVQVSAICSS